MCNFLIIIYLLYCPEYTRQMASVKRNFVMEYPLHSRYCVTVINMAALVYDFWVQSNLESATSTWKSPGNKQYLGLLQN